MGVVELIRLATRKWDGQWQIIMFHLDQGANIDKLGPRFINHCVEWNWFRSHRMGPRLCSSGSVVIPCLIGSRLQFNWNRFKFHSFWSIWTGAMEDAINFWFIGTGEGVERGKYENNLQLKYLSFGRTCATCGSPGSLWQPAVDGEGGQQLHGLQMYWWNRGLGELNNLDPI